MAIMISDAFNIFVFRSPNAFYSVMYSTNILTNWLIIIYGQTAEENTIADMTCSCAYAKQRRQNEISEWGSNEDNVLSTGKTSYQINNLIANNVRFFILYLILNSFFFFFFSLNL